MVPMTNMQPSEEEYRELQYLRDTVVKPNRDRILSSPPSRSRDGPLRPRDGGEVRDMRGVRDGRRQDSRERREPREKRDMSDRPTRDARDLRIRREAREERERDKARTDQLTGKERQPFDREEWMTEDQPEESIRRYFDPDIKKYVQVFYVVVRNIASIIGRGGQRVRDLGKQFKVALHADHDGRIVVRSHCYLNVEDACNEVRRLDAEEGRVVKFVPEYPKENPNLDEEEEKEEKEETEE